MDSHGPTHAVDQIRMYTPFHLSLLRLDRLHLWPAARVWGTIPWLIDDNQSKLGGHRKNMKQAETKNQVVLTCHDCTTQYRLKIDSRYYDRDFGVDTKLRVTSI